MQTCHPHRYSAGWVEIVARASATRCYEWLAGLAYAASVRAFAATGAEWVARPSVRPRRTSDSPASMFGSSWGLFVDKLVGPDAEQVSQLTGAG
jgi:hypothetical protein